MKQTLLAVTLAGGLLATPSHAQDAAPAHFLKQETIITLGDAAKEVQAVLGKERTPGKRLEAYSKFQFSPELRPKLQEIFGTERPLPMTRVAGGVKGQVNYVARLAPYAYKQDNGTDFTWTELVSKVNVDKSGRATTSTTVWPSLVISRPDMSVSLLNMNMISKQQTGADEVTYGTAVLKIGSIVMRDAPAGDTELKETMRFEDIEAKSDVRRRGAMAEIIYGSSIKAIVFGNERVEHVNSAFRLTNVPVKAVAELGKQWREQQGKKLEAAEEREQLLKALQDFGKRVAIAGATLFIDNISIGYHGNTASLKGRIGFQKVVEADFKDLSALLKKLVGRIEVRLPVALVRDASRAFITRTINPAAPDAAKQIDAGTDSVVSMVVGRTVSGGYGVVEQDELRTVIEIKDGKVTVNGKPVEVPAGVINSLNAKAAPQPAPAPTQEAQ
ncbi:DUF945 family protein [Pseudoduganella sp. FT25W]|uniref:DUF945 family protein n=1 Tax=Duganella alba TaxID=2666081 RepID=A0A6L5QHN8_9BURK|nr:DUF945 family protein [Duganella alba]MRX08802.1 DUF945 family protein [Duganella alba]MRX18710.1 DUF945 family protein [Duganella alba]